MSRKANIEKANQMHREARKLEVRADSLDDNPNCERLVEMLNNKAMTLRHAANALGLK